jgi:hypothetical protein
MNNRPFTLVAAIVFGLMALVHAYRLVTHFQLIIGSHVISEAVSWAGMVIAAVLSFGLFREAMR